MATPRFSRTRARAVFPRIVTELLGFSADDPGAQAFARANINSVLDLMDLEDDDVENLEFNASTDPDNPDIRGLDRGTMQLVRLVRSYLRLIVLRDGSPTNVAWETLEADDFDEYRMTRSVPGAQLPAATTSTTTTTRPSYTPVQTFKRNMKLDPSAFPTLKDDRYHDAWHRSVQNNARSQFVDNVIDPTYVPPTAEDGDLFDAQQKYMYSVFDKTVLTDRGKEIVRKYQATYDAQKVYKELHDYHHASTLARMSSSTLLTYITSASYPWRWFVERYQRQLHHQLDRQGSTVRQAEPQRYVFRCCQEDPLGERC